MSFYTFLICSDTSVETVYTVKVSFFHSINLLHWFSLIRFKSNTYLRHWWTQWWNNVYWSLLIGIHEADLFFDSSIRQGYVFKSVRDRFIQLCAESIKFMYFDHLMFKQEQYSSPSPGILADHYNATLDLWKSKCHIEFNSCLMPNVVLINIKICIQPNCNISIKPIAMFSVNSTCSLHTKSVS